MFVSICILSLSPYAAPYGPASGSSKGLLLLHPPPVRITNLIVRPVVQLMRRPPSKRFLGTATGRNRPEPGVALAGFPTPFPRGRGTDGLSRRRSSEATAVRDAARRPLPRDRLHGKNGGRLTEVVPWVSGSGPPVQTQGCGASRYLLSIRCQKIFDFFFYYYLRRLFEAEIGGSLSPSG